MSIYFQTFAENILPPKGVIAMGLFNKKEKSPKEPVICDACGRTTTGVTWNASDGIVCYDCIKASKIGATPSYFSTFPISYIRDTFDRKKIRPTIAFESVGPIMVNREQGFWCFNGTPAPVGMPLSEMLDIFWMLDSPLFKFEDVTGLTVLLDGTVVQEIGDSADLKTIKPSKKMRIQMIVSTGKYNGKSYQILIQDAQGYELYLKLFCEMMGVEVPKSVLKESIPLADAIGKAVAESIGNFGQTDTTEELRKFKSLLDDGIITQDEFDAKKKQLLGL